MESFQGGFQDLWLQVLLPIGGVVFLFAMFKNHVMTAVGAVVAVAVCGGLAYFPSEAAVTMANGAGRLLGAAVSAFVPA